MFLNKLEAFTWSIELIVGIEKITKTNNPTKNIFKKFSRETIGLTFTPNPSDKYLSAIGTIKKLDP